MGHQWWGHQVWNDNDSTHLALWKQLVFYDRRSAGIGLLADIFADLTAEFADKEHVLTEANLEVDRMRMEDAMVIIGDKDGRKLRLWIEAYQTDFDDFKHDFAWPWFDQCRNEDVFGLFD